MDEIAITLLMLIVPLAIGISLSFCDCGKKIRVFLEKGIDVLAILIFLAAVVVSLFSGRFFLVKDRDSPESTRMLTSLKIRVGLSITLVIFLVAAYSLGWLSP